MRIRAVAKLALTGMALLAFREAQAQPGSRGGQRYELESGSSFAHGCFDLCACPLVEEHLQGTFELRHVDFDGLYDNYAVSNVLWFVPRGDVHVPVRGSGTYRIGGEIAVRQQMSLDLSVGGEPPLHFDSGLVSGGGNFPEIDIEIAARPRPACYDTVIDVRAGPIGPTPVNGELSPAAFDLAVPNPFARRAEMRLTLADPGAVEIRIYDVLGRVVRRVVEGAWLGSGSHRISWDGCNDAGLQCAGGVYFVGATLRHERIVRRLVKAE
jgi:hypothetical protein